MKARAVIGANFGDEGKGLLVDYFCGKGLAEVVVRYSGGANAGHTVVTPEGDRHVFRQVGSGAFLGVPTFLSEYVAVDPLALMLELRQLSELGVKPEIYASPECLVTTFADILINRRMEDQRGDGRHGSTGMGFSETIERSQVPELRITMADLFSGGAGLETKIAEICDRYARFRTGKPIDDPEMARSFLRCAQKLPEVVFPAGIGQCKDPVFEGSQGLLLDMDNKDSFPHVTRSNTGLKNVRALCARAGITDIEPYYVSRTYLTRHGAGPLPGEDPTLWFADDTNTENDWQGKIRFAPLDTSGLLRRICRDAAPGGAFLLVTHCDQWDLARDSKLQAAHHLSSWGPTREDVRGKT